MSGCWCVGLSVGLLVSLTEGVSLGLLVGLSVSQLVSLLFSTLVSLLFGSVGCLLDGQSVSQSVRGLVGWSFVKSFGLSIGLLAGWSVGPSAC